MFLFTFSGFHRVTTNLTDQQLWTLNTLTELREACCSLDVLWSCMTSQTIFFLHTSNFPIRGKIYFCSIFLHVEIMALTVVIWCPRVYNSFHQPILFY